MSHDQGRPSLFAGMEDGATPGSDTQRVRILSTLESTRRTQRPARKGPPPAKAPASTQSRAWAVTLGLGVVTLLVSFVLIVQGQRPPNKLLQPVAPQAKAPEQAAPVATAAPAVAPAASAEHEAPITTADTLEALPPTSASSSSIPSRDPMAALAQATPNTPASAPSPTAAKASQAAPGKSNKLAKSTKSNRGDHDVALIEAVMNRGASRPSSR